MQPNPTSTFDYAANLAVRSITRPEGRTYPTPAGSFPSITTVLGKTKDQTFLTEWRARLGEAEANRQSKVAADRGTLVHTYLEAYLKLDAKDDDSIDAWTRAAYEAMNDGGQTANMAYKLRQAVRGHLGEIYCQETPLWSPTLKVAGAVDCIGTWDGEPAATDFKTSRKPKREEWIRDYFLQVAFYARAHNELFGTSIDRTVILITCETGEVQTFVSSATAWNAELENRIAQYYDLQADDHMAALAA